MKGYIMTCEPLSYEMQTDVVQELFSSLTKSIKKAMDAYAEELLIERIEVRTFELLTPIYMATSEVKSFRDMIDIYYINDIEVDSKILHSFYYRLEDTKDKIEDILDKEEFNRLSPIIGDRLHSALGELYAELVNISFDISLKIGESCIGSESNYDFLKEA
ncbi:MAG: hypothetical protein QM493_10420 [Sulfurovum sp.]